MKRRWLRIRNYAEHSKVLVVLMLLICIITACSKTTEQEQQAEEQSSPASKVTVTIEGGSYIPNLSERIEIDWKSGMTVTDSLKQTGIVKISEEDGAIMSVGDVALDTKMGWGIVVNDEELRQPTAMEKIVGPGDTVVVFVKRMDVKTNSLPTAGLTLSIDGGTTIPEMTNTYVVSWKKNMNVNDLIDEFAQISLSDDGKQVLHIGQRKMEKTIDFTLKVNGKKMTVAEGRKLVLQPDDQIEFIITP
ncbi:hypothetical protein M3661_05665 [Paenibacillus sp. MER 180]|uniref:hypothetical protein n=1 Tax=unclassified Paenibacillus TaxID=185978 RepID=UPI0008064DB0|nr:MULTISPECIES: hypothetical protein [unclassified Paenibacillus]MCM3289613.1 hypothetical protein [Paenibacillus sp. MER 180]OBY79272.1 hypothetical protein BBG47_12270 [Paenibacillus sp. KS1]